MSDWTHEDIPLELQKHLRVMYFTCSMMNNMSRVQYNVIAGLVLAAFALFFYVTWVPSYFSYEAQYAHAIICYILGMLLTFFVIRKYHHPKSHLCSKLTSCLVADKAAT